MLNDSKKYTRWYNDHVLEFDYSYSPVALSIEEKNYLKHLKETESVLNNLLKFQVLEIKKNFN